MRVMAYLTPEVLKGNLVEQFDVRGENHCEEAK